MPDFFQPVVLSAPIPQDVRDAANRVFMRAQYAMPWVGSLQGQAGLIFNAGKWPNAASSTDVSSDPTQQQQWLQFRNAYAPLTNAVLRREMEVAKAEGAKLEANVAFWENVRRATAAVATLGLSEAWDALVEKLHDFRAARQATAASIAEIQKTATDPRYASRIPQAAAALTALRAQQAELDAGTIRALGPLASYSEAKAEAGLSGPAPMPPGLQVALAAIGAATILGITAGLTYWVKRQYDTKDQANANAQDILKARDQVDLEDYRAGKITRTQYEASRDRNVAAANTLNAQQGSVSLFSGPGIVLGVAAVAAILIGVAIYRRKRAAAA